MIEVHQLPVLKDNYAYLIRESNSGLVASIDTPHAAPIIAYLEGRRQGARVNGSNIRRSSSLT